MKWKFEVKLHKVKNAGTIVVELNIQGQKGKDEEKNINWRICSLFKHSRLIIFMT